MHNIKLKLTYDGSKYLGWQKTKMGPSVEETLENAIMRVVQHPVILQAASRTDAGVHAMGQFVNFFTPKTLILDKLQYNLNEWLPKDIGVQSVELAPHDFHPTLACKSKEYHYYVYHGRIQPPIQRTYSWHYPYELDIAAMRAAVPLLIGHRDFSSFCNAKNTHPYPNYKRHLESIELNNFSDGYLRIEVCGNNFLYKMVRNIVGTLVYIGCKKINLSDLSSILENGDRTQAGVTAPAYGLFLYRVNY